MRQQYIESWWYHTFIVIFLCVGFWRQNKSNGSYEYINLNSLIFIVIHLWHNLSNTSIFCLNWIVLLTNLYSFYRKLFRGFNELTISIKCKFFWCLICIWNITRQRSIPDHQKITKHIVAIWCLGSWTIFVHAMVWCLVSSNHYLKQCGLGINKSPCNISQ